MTGNDENLVKHGYPDFLKMTNIFLKKNFPPIFSIFFKNHDFWKGNFFSVVFKVVFSEIWYKKNFPSIFLAFFPKFFFKN